MSKIKPKNVNISSDATDLFAPTHRPHMPGQDPNRPQVIYDQLCRLYVPRDLLEAMWINDLAAVQARIEYIRTCYRGRQIVRLRRSAYDSYISPDTLDDDELRMVRGQIRTDFSSGDAETLTEVAEDPNHPFIRLLGEEFGRRIDQEADFLNLELAALRERDRIIAQIEARRSHSGIREAVKAFEAQQLQGNDNND